MTVECQPFGQLADGTPVVSVLLTNSRGSCARIISFGAALQTLSIADPHGPPRDVVLGFNTPQEYVDHRHFFGATVGRYANRIARGRFQIDGVPHTLDSNDGTHHLHGGFRGLDTVIWTLVHTASGPSSATFVHQSPNGAGGYPGQLDITGDFTLTDDNELIIEYRASTDRATMVNITHHSYFNLAGEATGDIYSHQLQIEADAFTPVDSTLIPTGELRSVNGTPFDFREAAMIGARLRENHDQLKIAGGFDHNFVVRGRPGELRSVARLIDPESGRSMELFATSLGVQLYSGNFLDGSFAGKSGRVYRKGAGLCLEPQCYPDSPNQPHFPNAVLLPGATYRNKMIFKFATVEMNL